MKLSVLVFSLLISLGVMTTVVSNSVLSSTLENNTVLSQAQKSLQAKFNSTPSTVTQSPTVIQDIRATSMVKDVYFTWNIITSDSEVSVNLRYVGDGNTPPVNIAATAVSKSPEGKPVTMKGNTDLNSGWTSPNTVAINMNGESTLYDSTSINVVASPLGSSPSLPSTTTESNGNGIKSSTAPSSGTSFTFSNLPLLIANPSGYTGSTITISGKIFNFPTTGELQMYAGGDTDKDLVVYYDDSVNSFVSDDCIKVSGTVEEPFEGTNAFSATLVSPAVTAKSIQKVDCAQAINPAEKTVNLEATQLKAGIKFTVHKIEFSEKNTRVFMTIENLNGKASISFYGFEAKAIQGKKQYDTTYSYDVDYPQIKSDILPGIVVDGVILFEPLDYKTQTTAKFQFQAARQDTYSTFPFIFNVRIPS